MGVVVIGSLQFTWDEGGCGCHSPCNISGMRVVVVVRVPAISLG